MILRRTAVVLALLCCACASTPEATPERDAMAKRFETPDRDAAIYIYRHAWPVGGDTTLWVDGRLVGTLVAGTYFRVPVLAGTRLITTMPPDMGRLAVEARPHDLTFVGVQAFGGFEGSPNSVLRHVEPDAAMQAIRACCTLLENWRADQPRFFW